MRRTSDWMSSGSPPRSVSTTTRGTGAGGAVPSGVAGGAPPCPAARVVASSTPAVHARAARAKRPDRTTGTDAPTAWPGVTSPAGGCGSGPWSGVTGAHDLVVHPPVGGLEPVLQLDVR